MRNSWLSGSPNDLTEMCVLFESAQHANEPGKSTGFTHFVERRTKCAQNQDDIRWAQRTQKAIKNTYKAQSVYACVSDCDSYKWARCLVWVCICAGPYQANNRRILDRVDMARRLLACLPASTIYLLCAHTPTTTATNDTTGNHTALSTKRTNEPRPSSCRRTQNVFNSNGHPPGRSSYSRRHRAQHQLGELDRKMESSNALLYSQLA